MDPQECGALVWRLVPGRRTRVGLASNQGSRNRDLRKDQSSLWSSHSLGSQHHGRGGGCCPWHLGLLQVVPFVPEGSCVLPAGHVRVIWGLNWECHWHPVYGDQGCCSTRVWCSPGQLPVRNHLPSALVLRAR